MEEIAVECGAHTHNCTTESPLRTITPQKLRNYASQCDRNVGVITPQFPRSRSYGFNLPHLLKTDLKSIDRKYVIKRSNW